MKMVISINKSQSDTTAKYRLKVLQHYWKHGLVSTLDAFPVSRPTVFRWQQELHKSDGKLISLIPKSTRPKTVKKMQTEVKVVEKIKTLRQQWPNLSKHKLKPLLDVYCEQEGLTSISATTIGKVIKRNRYFFKTDGKVCHDPNGRARGKR